MKTTDLRFQIAKTQRDQQTALQGALLVVFFAVITASVGPQFIYQYALQNAPVEQQMLILGNLPVVSYGIAVVVFLWALVRNFFRSRTIRMYEQELQLLAYAMMDDCMCCVGDSCECVCHTPSHDDFASALSAVEDSEGAVADDYEKKTVKKAMSSKSTKKSTSSKKSTKKSTSQKLK